MNRRELLPLLGGAVTAWPLAARAQQGNRVRRIGVLMNLPSDDPESVARIATFAQGLGELGWTIGRNVQIEYRSVGRDADSIRRNAAELVAVAPDVILASGAAATAALQRVSRTVPIVFASTVDPVGAGLVATMARPDGNATGFMIYEYGLSSTLHILRRVADGIYESLQQDCGNFHVFRV